MLNSGALAKGILGGTAISKVYTVPSNVEYVITELLFINKGTSAQTVTVYVTNNTLPTYEDSVEYNASIIPGGILERSCISLKKGESMFISCTSSDVIYRLTGIDSNVGLQTSWSSAGKSISLNIQRADTNKNLKATISYIKIDSTYVVDLDVSFGTTDAYGNLNFNYTPVIDTDTQKISIWVYSDGDPVTRASFIIYNNNLFLI